MSPRPPLPRVVGWVVAAALLVVAVTFLRSLQPAWHGSPVPRPLAAARDEGGRRPFPVVVGSLTAGLVALEPADSGLVVHYWAAWNRESGAELTALDSLLRVRPPGPRVVAVTSDPMPSVARYVRRHRLRLEVLLDPGGALRGAAPRTVVPSTLVFDGNGRLVGYREGPVDWWSPETWKVLERATRSPAPAPPAPPAPEARPT